MNETVARIFSEIAGGLEGGFWGKKPKIALTGPGSEHGEENVLRAAVAASRRGIEVLYIGSLEAEGVVTVRAGCADEAHRAMEGLLESKRADAAVTMHYSFPIGVATVGRVVAPANGREVFLATTTGASGTDRVEGMVRNAVSGIIAAKACGVVRPNLGILNIDGARQAELALKELRKNGYDFDFAASGRSDGGAVMRGNDLLRGVPDVMVTDSLTGNVLVKMMSAYNSGGNYEVAGYGYGPGIGRGYDKLVLIISRASGAPLIANAVEYAAQLVRGNLFRVAEEEYKKAGAAGLEAILQARREAEKSAGKTAEVQAPTKEPVTASVPGVEVMDLEEAVRLLWKNGIYAESGMGCTGPLVMMSEKNYARAAALLKEGGYI